MSSKGVTPVVATALLLGLAVSAVVSATLFMDQTLTDLKNTYGDDIKEEAKTDKSELSIQAGYERNGWLIIDVQNTGEVTIPVLRENGNKRIQLYIDGQPVDIANGNTADNWQFYPSGSSKNVLGLDETLNINTTVGFPAQTNSTDVELQGPYDTGSAIICYNDGSGSC